jgi:hypothetical protein
MSALIICFGSQRLCSIRGRLHRVSVRVPLAKYIVAPKLPTVDDWFWPGLTAELTTTTDGHEIDSRRHQLG